MGFIQYVLHGEVLEYIFFCSIEFIVFYSQKIKVFIISDYVCTTLITILQLIIALNNERQRETTYIKY